MLLNTNDSTGFVIKRRFGRRGEKQDVQKPKVVINYTTSTGGVDRKDQYASSFCFLFWGMEMGAINSYILY